MRYRSLGWIIMGAWLGVWPVAAHADYLSSALSAMKKGDMKSAQIDLRNAVRNDPQNAEAHYWLGRISFELGDPVAAEREAMAARDRGFDPHRAVPLLSQALLAQNKFQHLLDVLKPEGRDALLDASILVARGYAEVGLHKPDDAQKSFAEAEKVAPNAVEPLLAEARLAVARSDLAGAQEKIDRALAAQPKSAEALLAKAQLLRLKHDTKGAITVLDALITDQPSVTQARLDRASLEIGLGKTDAARADISTVLKATPGNVQAIYLQAVMEAQAKNFKAADADLDRIAGYIGRIQRAYYLQAVVKEQLGQLEQADEAARKYLGRAPNDLAAYKILARIQFAKHRPDQVIETLAKVAETGKGDAETYDLLGRAYAATGRSNDAVTSFQKAETLAPNDVGLQTRLASVRMGMGEPDAAMGDLEHTLQLAPKLPAIGEALFFAAVATGDLTKATDALVKIKAAQGDTDVVGNLEGLLKLAEIDIPGADAKFAELVRKYPDFSPAKVNLARVRALEGKSQEAESLLSDVLAKQPAAEPALGMLASTYSKSNRIPLAVTLVERARAADPANERLMATLGELYIRAGDPQKALDLVNAQKGPAATTIAALSLRATAQLALGQKKEARETYAQLLKQNPNVIGARRQLVALLIEAGDFESARNALTAGIAADPRSYQLYQDLTMIDLKSTGVDAALATADRLQAQDRDFPAIKALKGDVYMAANRPTDAVTTFAAAMKDSPSSVLATRLASAQLRSGHRDDAVKTLTDWIAKHPADLVAMEQLAEIQIALNQLDQAQTSLEAILKQKPHNAVALNNLAWVYQQRGDKRAQDLARQAYVLSPGAQTADTLGWIMTSTGNAATGLALLRQANEQTADPRIRYHYAVALKDSGDKDEAIKQLNSVVGAKGEFKEKAEAQKLLDALGKGS
ncbi:MAG TPA: XrtA/PEP-CTERM system TPR-repeat protein PrsT [Acetobacteraceae bacterium]|nr:XrtA/PEP-CTERM system TPR-repeat protein PrsT [Acetobacteraceae bacterium]